MTELGRLERDTITTLFRGERYTVLYFDYDRADGIKVFEDITQLTTEELENFYRIYAFNDERMVTIYSFGEEELRYDEITKKDFIQAKERYIYTQDGRRFHLRVGTTEKHPAFQYIGFVGGGK